MLLLTAGSACSSLLGTTEKPELLQYNVKEENQKLRVEEC